MNIENSELSEKELKRLKRLEEKKAKKLEKKKRKIKDTISRATRYLLILAIIGGLGYLLVKMSQTKKFPKVGDHWHADYEIIICGMKMPALPYTQGNNHTHGDGKIHIHPEHDYEAGRNANLGRFFRNAGGLLTEYTLRYPGGKGYKNWDLCPDGKPGKIKLFVNGRENGEIDKYVPEDFDKIRIEFTTE